MLGLVLAISLVGCATIHEPTTPEVQTSVLPPVQEIKGSAKKAAPPQDLPPLAELKPRVAASEKMPYERRLFSLSARSTPLQDVLLGVAKEAGLNLVMEKGVDPMERVSVEVRNLSLEKALGLVLASYKYFFDIEGNILRIRALETRWFHFDYPLVSNAPESDVGGDVLGGEGGSSLSGEFSIDASIDEASLDVWKQIEEALEPGEEGGLVSEQGWVQINPMSGTIVVTDCRENLLLVEKYLGKLEKSLRRQVVIEAKIVEISLSQGHQYGVDWSYLTDELFGVEGEFSVSTNLGSNSTGINIGWIKSTGTHQWSSFLDAMATQGDVNVLSSPHVNVLNNQTALISVGRAIPYLEWEVREVDEGIYEPVPTVQRSQAGVTLGVTPQIGEDGVTSLHVVPIITDLVEYRTFNFQNNTFEVPVIDVRETDTIVRVPDGATVVIGGLIQEKTRDNSGKVPLLGDIPLFGKLFSQQVRESEKIELVILLTPRIVVQ